MADTINTPRGIRFDCSGCGNCCFGWPVPLTDDDILRLSKTMPELPTRSLPGDSGQFTRSLEKRSDGYCAFLTEDKRCRVHAEFGVEMKPSMCRLFPWSFNLLPSGVFVYVSFASTAVLFNQGRLLSEQSDALQSMFELHKLLFPKTQDWSRLQWLDGSPMSWQDFCKVESEVFDVLHQEDSDAVPARIFQKLETIDQMLEYARPRFQPRLPRLEARPKIIDELLLKHLNELLLPEDAYSVRKFDFDAIGLMKEIVAAPDTVLFEGVRFGEIADMELRHQADEYEKLLDRFIYSRLFAKLYFGPGFHNLSFVAGLRLFTLFYILLKVKLKATFVLRNKVERSVSLSNSADLLEQFEYVRTLERRITQLRLSRETLSVLEVLLSDRERLPRMAVLAV